MRIIVQGLKENHHVSAVADRKQPETKRVPKLLLPKDLVLRCVVFQDDTGAYNAECIDLDILVYGKTPYDALHSLKDAIGGYLEVAFKGDLAGLLPRPAPWTHRLRYHLYALRAALSAGAKRNFLLSDWSPGPSPCYNH